MDTAGLACLFCQEMANMKQAFLILLLAGCCQVYAQSGARISGIVLDSETRQPLSWVTITLVQKTGNTLQRTLSDSLGSYTFKAIAPGTYQLLYSFAGYDSLQSPAFDVEDTGIVVCPVVLLQQHIKSLQAVVVTAIKPLLEMKTDGLVYHATSEVQQAGSNTLDLLRKVPLVTVDPNGGIGVAGAGSTRIFIDGKPAALYGNSPADYLTLLPADRIEKVQVITQPSSRYDAEGASTVILIFTKKNRLRNLTGTVRTMGAAGGYRTALQNGFSLFYRWKKLALSTGGSYTHSMRIDRRTLERKNADNSSGMSQTIFDTMHRKSPTFNLNMDIELDSLNSLNINGTYVRWRSADDMLQQTGLQHDQSFRNFDRTTFLVMDISVYTASLAYSKKYKRDGQELSFLGFYNKRDRRENYQLTQRQQGSGDYREEYKNPSVNEEWSVQLDYTHPIVRTGNKQVGKWEAGVKASLRKLDSYYQTTPYDQQRSGSFSYNQDVYAAYFTIETQVGKWSLRPGIRYEQTRLQAYFNKVKVAIDPYGNLVPNVNLSRNLKNGDMLSVSYSQSISRPFQGALNPAVNYSDSFNITRGNPALDPSVNRRLESAYTFSLPGNGFLRLSLYGAKTANSLVMLTRLNAGGVAETTWENAGLDQSVGFTAGWNQPIGAKLRVTVNVNGGWQQYRIPAAYAGNSGWFSFSSIYINYTIGKGYNLEGYIMAQTARIELQGRSAVIFPQYYLLGIGKRLWSDKLAISFRTDSFFTPLQPFTGKYRYADFTQTNTAYLSNQLFQLSVNWRFNTQTKETRSRAASKAQQVPTE